MPDQNCICIREQLSRFPGSNLGFVIYRLTYKSDEEWSRFLAHFKSLTHKNLRRTGDEDLIPYIAWDVHEDPAMEDAELSQIRAHFLEQVENLTTIRRVGDQLHETKGIDHWSGGIPRNMACVAVDQMCVERCLRDSELDDLTAWEEGIIKLVSIEEEEDWTHVGLSYVFPRLYALLDGPGWDVIGGEGVFRN